MAGEEGVEVMARETGEDMREACGDRVHRAEAQKTSKTALEAPGAKGNCFIPESRENTQE